ncbi:hypothetical protein D3C85_1605470 [compost metagenome]
MPCKSVSGFLTPKITLEQVKQCWPQKTFDVDINHRLVTSPSRSLWTIPLRGEECASVFNHLGDLSQQI